MKNIVVPIDFTRRHKWPLTWLLCLLNLSLLI
jgi:hypothetical protein